MSIDIVFIVAIGVGTSLTMLVLFVVMIALCYRTVGPDKALIRCGAGEMQAKPGCAGGLWVIPMLHSVDVMDITVKRLLIELKGSQGLLCRDGTRIDCEAEFHLRIGVYSRDILEVAEAIGCQRAANLETLRELFDRKFTDALRQTASPFDANDLVTYTEYERYLSHVLDSIGGDLNGYQLDDAAIAFLGPN